MKKTHLILISLTVVIFISVGCSRKIVEKTTTGVMRSEVTIPCEKYHENTKHAFRALANSSDPIHLFAHNEAMRLAMEDISNKIEISFQSLFANYSKQYDIDTLQGFQEKVMAITKQVTDQTLTGVTEACQEDYFLSSEKYEVWIGIEILVDSIGKSIYDNISQDQEISLKYDIKEFIGNLEDEIEKRKNY